MNHIRFMFNRIKDYSLIYKETPIPVMLGFEDIESIEVVDQINEYCSNVLHEVVSSISYPICVEYIGCLERQGNEVFKVTSTDVVYTVSFTINTFKDKNAMMYVDIDGNYSFDNISSRIDRVLETLKIEIKNRLIKDWDSCTWLIDEQSEQLCSDLYPNFFRLENEFRAFVGRVLSYHIGYNWIDGFGLEKYSESSKKLSEQFQQRVSEFDNVNTQLMSLTLEALFDIVFHGVIYKENTIIKASDFITIDKICNLGNTEQLNSYLKKKREIKYKIWEDLLKPCFKEPDKLQEDVTKFINSRNHIAHNKLLSWNAYNVIIDELDAIQTHLDFANDTFDDEAVSKEVEYTQETLIDQDTYDIDYWRYRVASETGIDVLDNEEIQERFQNTLFEIHGKLLRHFQYDQGFSVSTYDDAVICGTAFSVVCNAAMEEKINIDIDMEIDDEMGEDSYLYIIGKKGDDDIYKCTVHYINGSGSEDEECRMQVDQDSVYEDEEIEEFVIQLIEYIEKELNPYVHKMQAMSYLEKGENSIVADFSCEFCGKNGISIREDFFSVGYCCYCGNENEVFTCEVCGKIFSESDGDIYVCSECKNKVAD